LLRKATTLSEPVRIVLLCDPAVWDAQIRAARQEVDETLEKAEGLEFIEKVISVLRTTTKTHVEMIDSLAALKGSARELFENFITGDKSRDEALTKLDEAMKDEDTRTALAFTRLHGITQQYRETSDPNILADSNPEGASWVELRALDRAQLRDAERACGPRPSLGAVLAGKGLDVARRAARRSEDSAEAYARYLSELTEQEQNEIYKFEDWNEAFDREVFTRSVHKIDGFDIERGSDGYPVDKFVSQCADAEAVISEAARHARQIGQLDPKAEWPSFWRSGTPESESAAEA
jgi:hypothetical protein